MPSFGVETIEVPACVHTLVVSLVSIELVQSLRPRPVAGQHPVVVPRLEWRWQDWDDSSAAVSPAQNPEQTSDERLTTAVHQLHEQISDERVAKDLPAVQDHRQQTTVVAQRRTQKMLSHTVSRTKADAAHEAVDPQFRARTPGRCEAHPRTEVQRGSRGPDKLHERHTGRRWKG